MVAWVVGSEGGGTKIGRRRPRGQPLGSAPIRVPVSAIDTHRAQPLAKWLVRSRRFRHWSGRRTARVPVVVPGCPRPAHGPAVPTEPQTAGSATGRRRNPGFRRPSRCSRDSSDLHRSPVAIHYLKSWSGRRRRSGSPECGKGEGVGRCLSPLAERAGSPAPGRRFRGTGRGAAEGHSRYECRAHGLAARLAMGRGFLTLAGYAGVPRGPGRTVGGVGLTV